MNKILLISLIVFLDPSFAFAGGERSIEKTQELFEIPLDLSDFYSKGDKELDFNNPNNPVYQTSISNIKLFAGKYHEKMISVKGYLTEWAGILFIYPTKADAEMENISVALMVETTKDSIKCKDNYVLIKSGFIYSEEKQELGLAPVNVIFTYDFDDPIGYQSLCYSK